MVPSTAWWVLHVVQDGALGISMALAFSASRRTGAHTPYGQMLFLLAVGFWFLLLGDLAFVARNALGLWEGPGGLNDALTLIGWLLLVLSVTLFVWRFAQGRTFVPGVAGLGAAAALVLFIGVLSPPGADPDAHVRATYIALDGAALAIVLGGLDRFRRLRRSALGRLYSLLAVALVVKSAGDMMWAYLAARGLDSIYATATYPLAGAAALAGLAIHHRDLHRHAVASPDAPWLGPHQMFLRDAAMQLREAAGDYAAQTFLLAAGGAFEDHKIAWRIDGATIEADAEASVWEDAVARGRRFATRHFGRAGEQALAQVSV